MDGPWAPLAGDVGFHLSFPSWVGKLYSADRTRFQTCPAQRAAKQAGGQKADVPLISQPRALPAGEQPRGGAPAPGRPGEAAAAPASVSRSVGRSVSQSVSRSVGQSVGRSVSRSVSRSISQTVSQTVSPSVSQSFCPGALGEAVPSSGQQQSPRLPARLGRTSHFSACLKAI